MIGLASLGAVVGAVDQLGDFFGDFFGGGGGSATSCPNQQPVDKVARALASAPRAELDQLRADWYAAHPNGEQFPADPATLAFHAAGGSDCRVSSAAGRRYESRFNAFVARWGTAPAGDYYATVTSPADAMSGGGAGGGTVLLVVLGAVVALALAVWWATRP